jgi:hypothetical protein
MNRRESMAVAGVLMAALVSVTGCATQGSKGGKFRLSAKTMCEAHGGTYNATAQHCTYTTQARPVSQSCQAQGGYYDTAAQFCEMGPP